MQLSAFRFSPPESKYNVETKTISADFGSVDIYPKIESGLAGLEIGVLGILHICNLGDSGMLYWVIWFCPGQDVLGSDSDTIFFF